MLMLKKFGLLVIAVFSMPMLPALAAGGSIHKAKSAIVIDGVANESSWQNANWRALDQHIVGEIPTTNDFSGRFKLLWDETQLYILTEITDDILFDQHANPLTNYWDDDCLEIFIDEDASGGNHQFNFNAFAYHVALDNQAVDIGEMADGENNNFILLNKHLDSYWRRSDKPPYNIIWEVALRIYDDSYKHPNVENIQPVKLREGKTLGFMLAYCDNDKSSTRESFIGSTKITPVNGDKNLGYITADVFEKIKLIK